MACNTWIRIFYFDYKKYSDKIFKIILGTLSNYLQKTILFLAFILTTIGCLIIYFINDISNWAVYTSLFIFLLSSMLCSQIQIKYYAYRNFAPIIICNIGYIVIILFSSTAIQNITHTFILITILNLLGFLSLNHLTITPKTNTLAIHKTYQYSWLESLLKQKITSINLVKFIKQTPLRGIRQVISQINTSLNFKL